MKLFDFEKQYVFTVKLPLNDDGDYIVMREPTTQEMAGFGDDNKENMKIIEKIFPDCIVESTFIVDDNGTPASNKQVYDVLKKSGSGFSEIVSDWINSCPFTSRSQKEEK